MARTAGSLFTGVGMGDSAVHAAGFNILFQVDFDDFSQEILKKRAPFFAPKSPQIFGDVREIGIGQLPNCALWIVTAPCQPFSMGGKRKGQSDNRNMWPEAERLIGIYRPKAIILENVASICSPIKKEIIRARGGRCSFTRVRRIKILKPAYALTIVKGLSEMGYVCQWGIISAADAGYPHQRDRWWCVAVLGDALSERQHKPRRIQKRAYPKKRNAPSRRRRLHQFHEAFTGGQVLGNATVKRQQKPIPSRRFAHSTKAATRLDTKSTRRNRHVGRTSARESRVGRNAHGLAHWLDRPIPVMGQGVEQYAHEPPRVVKHKGEAWSDRMKAIGNGLVPSIMYQLALGVRDLLYE